MREPSVDQVDVGVPVLEVDDPVAGVDLDVRAERHLDQTQAASREAAARRAPGDGPDIGVIGVRRHRARRAHPRTAPGAACPFEKSVTSGDPTPGCAVGIERDGAGLGPRLDGEVEHADIRVAAQRLGVRADGIPVEEGQQPWGAVAALEAEDRRDVRVAVRGIEVRGPVLVAAGEIRVTVVDMLAETDRQAPALEARPRRAAAPSGSPRGSRARPTPRCLPGAAVAASGSGSCRSRPDGTRSAGRSRARALARQVGEQPREDLVGQQPPTRRQDQPVSRHRGEARVDRPCQPVEPAPGHRATARRCRPPGAGQGWPTPPGRCRHRSCPGHRVAAMGSGRPPATGPRGSGRAARRSSDASRAPSNACAPGPTASTASRCQ